MYTAFYGLREKPFALVPDPRYLFLADSHREALAHLLYGIDQSEGFICITGEVGTGKTTLCRTLLDRLGGETEVAFLFNPSQTGVEMLQDIHAEFGLDSLGRSRSELTAELNLFLLAKRREKRRVLLIIDEAQNLTESTLEQVRLLSNLETQSQKLIQILLLGQPELDAKLDSSDLRQLRQRISVRWQLHPLTSKETKAYVRHRLHVAAGAERDLFTEGALREIHRRTGGVPRLINVLCDRVLLAGYVARAPKISAAVVRQAAKEIPDARRRRRSLFVSPRAMDFAGSTLRRLGSGAVFAAGMVLGLAVAAALLAGSTGALQERLQPLLSSLGLARPTAEVAAAPAGTQEESGVRAAQGGAPGAPAATVFVGNAASFETPALEPLDEAKIAEMSDVAMHGLAAGEFLGALLDEEDPHDVRRDAVNAILTSYEKDSFADAPPSDALAVNWLSNRGLAVHPLRDADLDSLLRLNHPALLQLRAADGSPRLAALLGLRGELAGLHGVTGLGALWVPIDELLQQWNGDAWVVWNDFESSRPVLAFGEQGESVAWLQEALSQLGYFDGVANGLFDGTTREALRSFQQEHELLPDGMAGPQTRMVLYSELERYGVPRIQELADLGDGGAS